MFDMLCRVKGKSIDEDAIKAAVKDVQAKRAKAGISQQQVELNQMQQPDSGEKLAAAVAS